jgi:hypothetical protein
MAAEGITEVGEFTLTADGTVTGPAEYMGERGKEKLREIEQGRCPVFRFGASGLPGSSPSPEVALLVAVQTDYAAWKGARTFRKAVS